jgi:ABC-type uncharacterized transport system permease subunit
MAYAPARMLSGNVELDLFAIQLAWLAVLLALMLVLFRAGERRLAILGG